MGETYQFLAKHTLPLVFGAVFVEQLGLPLPTLPWLLGAGALAATGKFNLLLGLGVTLVACLAADGIWFYLGRHRGNQLLAWVSRFSLKLSSCIRRTQHLFTKYGLRGLLVSKFVPVMSTAVSPLAGMCGISSSRFFLVDAMGSMLYCGSSLGIGYVFSHEVGQIWHAITRLSSAALILIIAASVLYVSCKSWRRRRLLHRESR